MCSSDLNDFFYAGPGISDLAALLGHHREGFKRFAGVKIDSTYLLSRTRAALENDRAALSECGLGVIVDLRRDQMHFDRIAFYPHIPNYAAGMALFGQIVDKMRVLGATDLIARVYDSGDMRNDAKSVEQRDRTWVEFARQAGEKGIRLHLVCDKGIRFSSAAALDSPNVLVIAGAKGAPSPYRLVLPSGSLGQGATMVHDSDGRAAP